MEEKSPQQNTQLNTPSTDESIAPAAETSTDAEQPQTINLSAGALAKADYKPETENMEVHHHAHHEHGKRNWKSYFWEFLMLFLAVFCGFLAEYQLEHKIEKERAVKYMHDMVENLKYDTARCNSILARNVLLGKNMDSLRAAISEAIEGNINSNRLYDLWLRTETLNQVAFNRAAITQLKNSGNLRLIENDSLVAAMIDYYDRKVFACETSKEGLDEAAGSLSKLCLQFFYYAPFDEMLKTEKQYGKSIPDSETIKQQLPLYSNPPLPLLNTEPQALKLLYNEVASKERAVKSYNSFIRWARETAENLILQIEKEYNFKE
ncbi:MAG: hypothetical protein K2Q24_06155 [Chitinophagaceae bacterium]|jgi:hypothetical protein|nr:hypothetical protein [Chitinophagaceae bacterium]